MEECLIFYSRAPPSARTGSTGWASASTSWTRATRCGAGARTWSSMSSREVVRWAQAFRFDNNTAVYCKLERFFNRFLLSEWTTNRSETTTTPMRWRPLELISTFWRTELRMWSLHTDTASALAQMTPLPSIPQWVPTDNDIKVRSYRKILF